MADWRALNQNLGGISQALGEMARKKLAMAQAIEMMKQEAQIKSQSDPQTQFMNWIMNGVGEQPGKQPIDTIGGGMGAGEVVGVGSQPTMGLDRSKLMRGYLSKTFGVPYEEFKTPEENQMAIEQKRQEEKGKLEAKSQVTSEELMSGANQLINVFKNAQIQAKQQFPASGKIGMFGKLSGMKSKISARVGYSPDIDIYNRRKKVFATTTAKAAGEVRPTDEDIRRFMAALPDVSLSDEVNDGLIQAMINDIQRGGAKAIWDKYSSKDNTLKNPPEVIIEKRDLYNRARNQGKTIEQAKKIAGL